MNDRTNASQWDFPTEEDKDKDLKGREGAQIQTSSQGDTKTLPASVGGLIGQSISTVAAL